MLFTTQCVLLWRNYTEHGHKEIKQLLISAEIAQHVGLIAPNLICVIGLPVCQQAQDFFTYFRSMLSLLPCCRATQCSQGNVDQKKRVGRKKEKFTNLFDLAFTLEAGGLAFIPEQCITIICPWIVVEYNPRPWLMLHIRKALNVQEDASLTCNK